MLLPLSIFTNCLFSIRQPSQCVYVHSTFLFVLLPSSICVSVSVTLTLLSTSSSYLSLPTSIPLSLLLRSYFFLSLYVCVCLCLSLSASKSLCILLNFFPPSSSLSRSVSLPVFLYIYVGR